MTTQNTEMAPGLTGPFQEDSAAGGRRAATVPHPSDGAHQGATEVPKGPLSVETDETAAIRDYWAAAKRLYLRGEYADYGSDDWKGLDIEDPRKLAGLVAFAELWRKYNPEIADDLNRQLASPEPLWQRATTEACGKAFQQLIAQQQRRKEAA